MIQRLAVWVLASVIILSWLGTFFGIPSPFVGCGGMMACAGMAAGSSQGPAYFWAAERTATYDCVWCEAEMESFRYSYGYEGASGERQNHRNHLVLRESSFAGCRTIYENAEEGDFVREAMKAIDRDIRSLSPSYGFTVNNVSFCTIDCANGYCAYKGIEVTRLRVNCRE